MYFEFPLIKKPVNKIYLCVFNKPVCSAGETDKQLIPNKCLKNALFMFQHNERKVIFINVPW